MKPSTDADAPAPTPVAFAPRRFGHVNMYVADLGRSHDFYHRVCGLEDAFDEPGLEARFLSNGNSHHDLALMQASEKVLVGRDGLVQKSEGNGRRPGLNHLAFELPTEADLVAAIGRAEAAGTTMHRYYDHQISRSVYLPADDGVELEFYSDSTPDWRELFASLGDQLLSERWVPGADGPPSEQHNYVEVLDHRPVPGAPVRPLRSANATVVVSDLRAALEFHSTVSGLAVLEADLDQGRWAILSGTLGLPDLLLVERDGEPLGFHHFGLELADLDEVDATAERLGAAGVPIAAVFDNPLKRSLVIEDPDGVPVELFARPVGSGGRSYADVATIEHRCFLI